MRARTEILVLPLRSVVRRARGGDALAADHEAHAGHAAAAATHRRHQLRLVADRDRVAVERHAQAALRLGRGGTAAPCRCCREPMAMCVGASATGSIVRAGRRLGGTVVPHRDVVDRAAEAEVARAAVGADVDAAAAGVDDRSGRRRPGADLRAVDPQPHPIAVVGADDVVPSAVPHDRRRDLGRDHVLRGARDVEAHAAAPARVQAVGTAVALKRAVGQHVAPAPRRARAAHPRVDGEPRRLEHSGVGDRHVVRAVEDEGAAVGMAGDPARIGDVGVRGGAEHAGVGVPARVCGDLAGALVERPLGQDVGVGRGGCRAPGEHPGDHNK